MTFALERSEAEKILLNVPDDLIDLIKDLVGVVPPAGGVPALPM